MKSPLLNLDDRPYAAAIEHLLFQCCCLCEQEKLLIIADPGTEIIARTIYAEAQRHDSISVELDVVPALSMHGQEPPATTAAAMCRADAIMCMTWYSMAHSQARLAAQAQGSRFLSMPEYSFDLLNDPALLVPYRNVHALVAGVGDILDGANQIRVTSAAGTDISMAANGRRANVCPGYVSAPGSLGSPPDIEANISPLEDSANGIVIVDGSIPHPALGLLTDSVLLQVVQGKIVHIDGADKDVRTLEGLFEETGTDKSRILAECGIGLNPKARLTGVMLTDEGALGTMQFGFGANNTVGGVNKVPFHLDFVFYRPSLEVDGIPVLTEGKLAPALQALVPQELIS